MNHDHSPKIPVISLCSGCECFGLALKEISSRFCHIAYCEREAYGIANLVSKMEDGLLDEAPVFTNLEQFPWGAFSEVMGEGVLTFGWPCQPVSHAGQRKATQDERWLFDIIADGIAIMQPAVLFAENVEGLLTARMPDGTLVIRHCIERLERLRFRVEIGLFSAEECGAPHRRKRVFILAYREGFDFPGWLKQMENTNLDGDGPGETSKPKIPGRRVQPETAGGMADARCSERWQNAGPENHCQQGNESGRSKEASGTGECGKVESDMENSASQRFGQGLSEPEKQRRTSSIDGTGNSVELGNSTSNDQCRTSNREDGQREQAGGSGELADPEHNAGSAQREFEPRERSDSEPEQNPEPRGSSSGESMADTKSLDGRTKLETGQSGCGRTRSAGSDKLAHSAEPGSQGLEGVEGNDGEEQPAAQRGSAEPVAHPECPHGELDRAHERIRRIKQSVSPIYWPGFVARPGEPQHDWEPSRVALPSSLFDLWNRIRKNAPESIRAKIAEREKTEGFLQTLRKMGVRVDGCTTELDNDSNTDELRLLGNGIYPAAAIKAFLTLSERLLK